MYCFQLLALSTFIKITLNCFFLSSGCHCDSSVSCHALCSQFAFLPFLKDAQDYISYFPCTHLYFFFINTFQVTLKW